jgi:hypothetical protein
MKLTNNEKRGLVHGRKEINLDYLATLPDNDGPQMKLNAWKKQWTGI